MDGAAFGGHPDVVSVLIDAGIPADVPHEHDLLTPLWRTTWMDGESESGQSHHYETAARLIEHGGADPNYIIPEGTHDHPGEAHTPLQSAVVHGRLEMLRLFLESLPTDPEKGKSSRAEAVNLARSPHHWSSLHLAMALFSEDTTADSENVASIVAELVVAGGNLSQANGVGKTPLDMAKDAVKKGQAPSEFPTTASGWIRRLQGAGMASPASLSAAAAAEAQEEADRVEGTYGREKTKGAGEKRKQQKKKRRKKNGKRKKKKKKKKKSNKRTTTK
jgi:hypothetical protein